MLKRMVPKSLKSSVKWDKNFPVTIYNIFFYLYSTYNNRLIRTIMYIVKVSNFQLFLLENKGWN